MNQQRNFEVRGDPCGAGQDQRTYNASPFYTLNSSRGSPSRQPDKHPPSTRHPRNSTVVHIPRSIRKHGYTSPHLDVSERQRPLGAPDDTWPHLRLLVVEADSPGIRDLGSRRSEDQAVGPVEGRLAGRCAMRRGSGSKLQNPRKNVSELRCDEGVFLRQATTGT